MTQSLGHKRCVAPALLSLSARMRDLCDVSCHAQRTTKLLRGVNFFVEIKLQNMKLDIVLLYITYAKMDRRGKMFLQRFLLQKNLH